MLKQDTPLPENVEAGKPSGTQGARSANDSSSSPAKTAEEMSHGQESYPGSRSGGESDKPAHPPDAGDVDPGSTDEADTTGQGGKPNAGQQESGNPWNG